MTKSELTAIAKYIDLPEGWKVLAVYPSTVHGKKISDTEEIVFGYPIQDRMSDSSRAYAHKRNLILKQLNGSDLRACGEHRWDEWGGGFGGGKWYEVEVGREVC